MKQTVIIFIGICLLLTRCLYADPVITFFFRNYPEVQLAQHTMEKLKKPNGIAKQTIEGILNHNRISGIFSSYFGFLNASDQNGQTTFPRKQSNAVLQLVITNKITPITMFQYTISHWELQAGVPASVYLCEQKEDETAGISFWIVRKMPTPENNYISPTDSLIIIAKPKNIYIPTGVSLTKPEANLVLPDMYVKTGIKTTRNALYMLNLTLFFRPIDLLYKKAAKSYETLVAE